MNNQQKKKITEALVDSAINNPVGDPVEKAAMAQLIAIEKIGNENQKIEGDLNNKQKELELREKELESKNKEIDLKMMEIKNKNEMEERERLFQTKENKKNRFWSLITTIIGGAATIFGGAATLYAQSKEKEKERNFYAWQAAESRKYESTGSYTAFSSKQTMNDVFKKK